MFHPITASSAHIDNLRTGTTVNADLWLNRRLHQTGMKSKENKKAAQRRSKYFFAFTLTLATLQRSKISALLKKPCSPLQRSLSQDSVVHITSLRGVPPLAQFNGQLGHYSRLTVSTDVPMAWHMGIHAHAHTRCSGTVHFLRRQRSYKPQNGLVPDFGEFACVCRHGSMYVFHGMLTGQVDLMASRQKSRLICLLHISTAQEEEVVRSGEKYQGSTCLQTTILP